MTVDIDRARTLARALLEALEEPSAALDGEVTLTGTIGRPEYKQPKGIPLFTAGLGIRRIDAQLEWVSLEAWRELAIVLAEYSRGQTVTVTGKWKTNEWVDQDGVIQTRDVFVVTRLDESDDAGSASDPSSAGQNGTM